VLVRSDRDRVDFVARAISSLVAWPGNLARFHFRPSANVGFVGAVAKAIERVFLEVSSHAQQIGPIAVGAESDQITRVAPWTFDTMAHSTGHRHHGMQAAGQRLH